MLHFERVDHDQSPPLDQYPDHTIFQSKEWLEFIAHTQNAKPVIATIKAGNRTVGRFTGLIANKFGVPILGSPFPGWSTDYMGFNLEPSVSRTDALRALEEFAFRQLGCWHFEMMDRRLSVSEIQQLGYVYRPYYGFEIDLGKTEDELLAAMSQWCRRSIRRAVRDGVQIEEAQDLTFVDDYYPQLVEVFAKRGLVPTYSKERVKALIEHLLPTGRLLLLRARIPDGTCIATMIVPAMNDTAHIWGGANLKAYSKLNPNEGLIWYAMRYWKARGIARYDMSGGGEYKSKYGGQEICVPWLRKSRWPVFEQLRNSARKVFHLKQRLSAARAGTDKFVIIVVGIMLSHAAIPAFLSDLWQPFTSSGM